MQALATIRKHEYWRLEYAHGHFIDEPANDGTIREAWANAQTLLLMHPQGIPGVKVQLSGQAPVFYRIRSIGMQVQSAFVKRDAGVRTDAVVFGRVKQNDSDADGMDFNLWALIEGRVTDCPLQFVDLVQIRSQLDAHINNAKTQAVIT